MTVPSPGARFRLAVETGIRRSDGGDPAALLVPVALLLLGLPSALASSAEVAAPPSVHRPLAADPSAALGVTPTVTPASGFAPLPVRFSANAAGGSPSYLYYWSFGDRHSSWIATPTHTFLTSGRFQTNLTVTDSLGATVLWSQVLDVASAPNLTIDLSAYPSPVLPGQMVHVNVTTTGGTAPYVYSWVGSIPGCAPQGGSSFECLVNVTPCSYPYFEVYVQDSVGHLAQGGLNLDVSGAPSCGPPVWQGRSVAATGGSVADLILFGPLGVVAAVAAIFYARRRRRSRDRGPPFEPV